MRRIQSGRRNFLKRTEGMSAVELALVLPVLLWLVSGTMDFGNLYLRWNIASEAAREGARIAAINVGKTKNDIETFIHDKYDANLIVVMDPLTSVADTPVTVTVSNPIAFFTPGIKAMFPSDFKVIGKTVMQVEK